MQIHQSRFLLLASALTLMGSNVFSQERSTLPKELKACANTTPPFVIMTNGTGSSGFSVDLFHSLLGTLKLKGQILELPWARCLNEVKEGRIDIAVDAYDDLERRKTFLYSDAYHTLTPQVFHLKTNTKIPTLPLSELKKLNGCGVTEYTYEHYNIDAKSLDLSAYSDQQMISKLAAGRCDYALEELEYIIGGRAFLPDWPNDSNVASFKPTWAQGPKLHFLISKHTHNAPVFLQAFNGALAASEKSGNTEKLRKKYLTATVR